MVCSNFKHCIGVYVYAQYWEIVTDTQRTAHTNVLAHQGVCNTSIVCTDPSEVRISRNTDPARPYPNICPRPDLFEETINPYDNISWLKCVIKVHRSCLRTSENK